ncbi:MAG: DUF134 domain-containing protein [Candidatus Gracilibacteria bacterium]|nr:DUF134 domain-containing protein [Candidatus Gracilibacteria bacterium]
MPRPRSQKKLEQVPEITFYKPQGIPLKNLQSVEISHEEWESLRLKHLEKLNQISCAKKMKTSQSTFHRILSSAQKKIGQAIVKGMAIKIIQRRAD